MKIRFTSMVNIILITAIYFFHFKAGIFQHPVRIPGPGGNSASIGGAIALIGTPPTAAGNTSVTTAAYNTSGAKLLVVVLGAYNTDPCGAGDVTDSLSNSWTCLPSSANTSISSSGGNVAIWYASNPTVSSSQTFTCKGGFMACMPAAFTNVTTTSPEECHNPPSGTSNFVSTGGGNSLSTGSVTPSVNNDLLVAAGSEFASPAETTITFPSPGTAFTVISTVISSSGVNVGGGIGYKIQSTAASISTTYSQDGTHSGLGSVIACFKHS